jgi:hypothetical protein
MVTGSYGSRSEQVVVQRASRFLVDGALQLRYDDSNLWTLCQATYVGLSLLRDECKI